MKSTFMLLSFLCVSIFLDAQITYEIDSSRFEYINADGKTLLKGSTVLKSEVNLRLQPSDTSGYILLNAKENPAINLYADESFHNVQITSKFNNSGGAILLSDEESGRNDVIRLVTNFQNSGDARVFTDEIQINGGSDLAEMFDITDAKENTRPGLLVSLDPNAPGKLMISQEAYDKKIAGVISGANGIKPGILMGQDNTIAHGDELVTLSGRTYVQCNTSNGSIQIGDFITSSDIAGEAMKASSKKKSRGAIIGKAMTNLESGNDFVLVLINLQ